MSNNQPALSCHTLSVALTLAKKFDAVHKKTVQNSNSNPTALLHRPSLPKNPFALFPDPLTLAPSPTVLRSLSSDASKRSATLPGTGGSRLAIVVARVVFPECSLSHLKLVNTHGGLWREGSLDGIRKVPVAFGTRSLHAPNNKPRSRSKNRSERILRVRRYRPG